MPSPKSRDLTGKLIDDVRQMIVDGTLQPGGKLPSERDLARQFGVNRSSLRQALKALTVMGVISQRAGLGTHLIDDSSALLNMPLDFLLLVDGIRFAELFEARRIFEPELAARAARRHVAAEIIQLEESIHGMRRHAEAGSLAGVAACDQRFHSLIWKMAGNRICLRMLAPLHSVMTNSFAVTWSLSDYTRAISLHSGILDAIRAGDPESAHIFMSEHLDHAESIVINARRAAG
jgi:GntR family transcriptional repressor for pyruvate dehydrogenase complex